MKRNDNSEFAGIERIKQRHAEQLLDFQLWANRGEWTQFHHAHYDWWMFPIDRPSSYGLTWTIYDGDVEEFTQDAAFMQRYRRGIELFHQRRKLFGQGFQVGRVAKQTSEQLAVRSLRLQ